MSAILKKALTNPFKLYKMAYNSAPYIETDLSKGELMGLVSKAGTCLQIFIKRAFRLTALGIMQQFGVTA